MKQYKVVPETIEMNQVMNAKSEKVSNSPAFIAKKFEAVIAENAKEGWAYHSVETHDVVSQGCGSSKRTTLCLLVFAKEV